MDLPTLCERFVPKFETLFLNLQETDAKALTVSALGWVLRALQAAEDPTVTLAQVLSAAARSILSLPKAEQRAWKRLGVFLYRLVQHKRIAEDQPDLFEALDAVFELEYREDVEEIKMTGAQVLLAQGRREGRKEGRIEASREMLLRQLTIKFKALPEDVVATVNTLTEKQLVAVAERMITAESLSDLNLP